MLAERGAELVLHGHNHRDSHLDFAWARGQHTRHRRRLGLLGRVHKGEPLGRYNLLRIARVDGAAHIELTTRGLDPSASRIEQIDRRRDHLSLLQRA